MQCIARWVSKARFIGLKIFVFNSILMQCKLLKLIMGALNNEKFIMRPAAYNSNKYIMSSARWAVVVWRAEWAVCQSFQERTHAVRLRWLMRPSSQCDDAGPHLHYCYHRLLIYSNIIIPFRQQRCIAISTKLLQKLICKSYNKLTVSFLEL